jgi:hypothetical protein
LYSTFIFSIGIDACSETEAFRSRIEVSGDWEERVMLRGGLREDFRVMVIVEGEVVVEAVLRFFGRGLGSLGRVYWRIVSEARLQNLRQTRGKSNSFE